MTSLENFNALALQAPSLHFPEPKGPIQTLQDVAWVSQQRVHAESRLHWLGALYQERARQLREEHERLQLQLQELWIKEANPFVQTLKELQFKYEEGIREVIAQELRPLSRKSMNVAGVTYSFRSQAARIEIHDLVKALAFAKKHGLSEAIQVVEKLKTKEFISLIDQLPEEHISDFARRVPESETYSSKTQKAPPMPPVVLYEEVPHDHPTPTHLPDQASGDKFLSGSLADLESGSALMGLARTEESV